MFRNHLLIALRTLRQQRGYTLLNVVGLAVGMAGGLLIFGFLRYHLSTDRHHANFDRIFRVTTDLHLDDGTVEPYPEAPLPMAEALRRDFPMVEHAAFLRRNRELTVSFKRPGQAAFTRFLERDNTALVEPEFFRIFDYRWLKGSPETALRQPNGVVLTESWAKRYFGEADPIGQTLDLNHMTTAKVTGIVADPAGPTDFTFGLFVSLATWERLDPKAPHDWWTMNSTDRLFLSLRDPKAATSLEAAFPALVKKNYGELAKYYQFHVQPLAEVHFDVARIGGVIRPALLWSLGLVGVFLVLTACINFVNLATAQALRRSKEVGIRKTLGSSRAQLVRQFLLETGLIGFAAAALALLLVSLTLPFFNELIQIQLRFQPDFQTVGFGLGLLLLVVVLAGGYPAAVLSGFNPWQALRGGLTASSVGGATVRRALVVTQFAVCQALLVGSLVVASQIRYVQRADLGFRKDNVVIANLPNPRVSTMRAFKQTLSQYPDIQSISFNFHPPSDVAMYGGSFKFEGRAEWEKFPVRERLADAGYLDTFGLKLLAGRNLAPSDTIREYLVNETLARKLGFRDPRQIIGRTLQYHLSPVPSPIVGVVKDFHQRSLREPIGPCLIASRAEFYHRIGVRISGQNPAESLQRIRQTWQRFYPDEVFEYTFLDEHLARFYETENLISRLINVFAGVAALICGLGLYGLVSFVVGQRTKEIGVRKVLGASVASIVALLSNDFLRLVLLGILIASPLAGWVMQRWLNEFEYRISLSGWLFAGAGLLAVGVALLTVSFQSVKAALANPVQSLKNE